jgi:hypothetical protein
VTYFAVFQCAGQHRGDGNPERRALEVTIPANSNKRKDIKGERLEKIALPKVKPHPLVSKPPVKLKQAAPALPERLAKIALPKAKPKKIVSKGHRQK